MIEEFLKLSYRWLRKQAMDLRPRTPDKLSIIALADRQAGSSRRRGTGMVFHLWFAWYPVWPEDEHGIFWLEPVWVRYSIANRRWSYRSFRTEQQKREQREKEYPF